MNTDRTLRRIAFVLSVWGFTTLATTAQLAWPGVIASYAAFAVLFFRPGVYSAISASVWRIANLALLFGSFLYAYHSHDIGNPIVYGSVYLQIQKIVRYDRLRDYMGVFLLSFGQVLLAAAISPDPTFVLSIGVFLFLSVFGLALLTIERNKLQVENEAAKIEGVGRPLVLGEEAKPPRIREGAPVPVGGLLRPRRFFATASAVCLCIIPVTVVFFILIPRLAVRKFFLRLRPFETSAVTGFSPEVDLSHVSEIRKDRTVVMRVWVDRRGGGRAYAPAVLRLRGIALDSFDGLKWRLSPRAFRNAFPIRIVDYAKRFPVPFAWDPRYQIRLKIEQDLRQTKWLFGPPFIAELKFFEPVDIHCFPSLHSFRLASPSLDRIQYRLTSYTKPPVPRIQALTTSPTEGNSAASAGETPLPSSRDLVMSDKVRAHYLALPRFIAENKKIVEFARQMTKDAKTPFEKVGRLNRFFHTNFRYTLKQDNAGSGRFLERFLFVNRSGHCEKFATAMAILCRICGVPARVVSGFYTTEFNRYEKFFYVRQSNAHAWVEVWLDGFGWLTVDPSPPSAFSNTSEQFAFLRVLSDYWDSWTVRWRRYVVDYSLRDQLRMVVEARNLLARAPSLRALAMRRGKHNPLSWLTGGSKKQKNAGGFAFQAAALAGLFFAWWAYRRRRRNNGGPTVRRHRKASRCPIGFYAAILAALAHEGWRKNPGQTPAEFAEAVASARPDLAALIPLTQAYYQARFSGRHPDRAVQAQASALLQRIGRNGSLLRLRRLERKIPA